MRTVHGFKAGIFTRWLISVLVYSIIFLPIGPSLVFADQPTSYLDEGIQLYDSGKFTQSQSKLAEAGAKDPDNPVIHIYLGLAQMQLGNSANAIASFDRYLKLSPDSPEAIEVRKNLTLLKTSYIKDEVESLVSGERKMFTGPETAKTIAVYTPVSLGDTNYTHLGRGLASMVIHDLVQVDKFTVVERMRMQALLDELALRSSNLTPREFELRMGRLLGAGRVIPGSYSVNDNAIAINTSLVRTDIGYTLGRQMASGSMVQFWELEKMLVFSILKDLGVKKKDIPASILSRVEKIHTKNLAAFSAYSAGIVASDQEDYLEAKKQFNKALEEDEDFELAALAVLAVPVAVFGVAAIIASLEGSASIASGATKAFAATTATTTTTTGATTGTAAGLSTGTWVAIGAGAVVVTVGTGAALSGGGSSSGGGGGGDDGGEELTEQTIAGFWNVSGNNFSSGSTSSGSITFQNNGIYSYHLVDRDSNGIIFSDGQGTGSWFLDFSDLSLFFDAGAIYSGTATGDSQSFTMVSDNGWTLNFSR